MLANSFAHGKIIHQLRSPLPLSPLSAEPQKLAASVEPDLLTKGGEEEGTGAEEAFSAP